MPTAPIRSITRAIAVGMLGIGLAVTPVAMAAASSTSASSTGSSTSTTTTTTTTTVKASSSTSSAAGTKKVTYEVIAGTFSTKAKATKRLTAITAKKISGLSIVVVGKAKRYRIEVAGLTKAKAKALTASLTTAQFFAYFVTVRS